MTQVFFIGAGPGDPELLTLKAARLIGMADLVLYAGSLVPREALAEARDDAKIVDSAPLTLEEQHALVLETVRAGGLVARVHTGDPALFGAVREQADLLEREGVEWEVVPGVSAAFAAAAAARVSFTRPGGTQSLIVTRLAGRTPVPESENLRDLARHGSALAIYLSAGDAGGVQRELLAGGLAPETVVVVGHRVGWPDGSILETTLAGMARAVDAAGFTRQAVFLVLPGQTAGERSKLYDKTFSHLYRR
jgi:precorrin-4/cobalt-precorrin-4 C11-methyltransferase